MSYGNNDKSHGMALMSRDNKPLLSNTAAMSPDIGFMLPDMGRVLRNIERVLPDMRRTTPNMAPRSAAFVSMLRVRGCMFRVLHQ
jgi:hypothetical protein